MERIISGIQQVGIGIPNVYEAWKWYRKNFGMDIPMFDDAGTAELMLPYTDNKPQERHAVLALNIQSGGGFEIWQYVSRIPEAPQFDIQPGDLGIYAVKIKSKDVTATYLNLKANDADIVGGLVVDPNGDNSFFVKDPYGNLFQIVKGNYWFKSTEFLTGGIEGVIIGVSDMEKSMEFYKNVLGYDKVLFDKTDVFDDFYRLQTDKEKVRRVLLTHSKERSGAFSKLLGPSQIELIQKTGTKKSKKIFENRLWGDLGFIHLCFDISGMDEFRKYCEQIGHPFTVDSSNSFDMGEAAGHFAYIEDPDGTLIELVETHKIPIIKKVGWYIDLKKRDPKKPLPNWMLKSLIINRVSSK